MNRLHIVKQLDSLNLSVFTPTQVASLFDKDIKSTRVLLSRLAKDDVLIRVKRGFYCLPSTNILSVASTLYPPSYISLWASFEYYGTTTQSPQVIDVINTMKSGEKRLSLDEGRFTIRFIQTKKSLIFGFKKVLLNGKTTFIAEKEKAIIDGLLFSRYVPFDEIIETINDGVNLNKIVHFAKLIGKQAMIKRLGYLLDNMGYSCNPKDFNQISTTFVPLDPSLPRNGTYDKTWYIIDNRRNYE
jgi:predicted transcriptional regulator of viral defense system